MLRSMTGFGSSAGRVGGVEYAVEVRSVNNRYFKPVTRLPDSWAGAEVEIERLLRGPLRRGAVTVTVRMKLPDEQAAYRVNTVAMGKYIEQLRPLEIDANPMMRLDLGSLLLLPGACEPPSYDEIVRETRAGLMNLVGEAISALLAMRQQEGKALEQELRHNCDAAEESLSAVARRAPLVLREYHDRLGSRVRELTGAAGVELDKDSLAREVAIFAERCDIAEEISRLAGHMAQFRDTLDGPQPAGRKLDFIAQEMLREANTIAAKANDSEIARAVVEIKTAVDRIKEQVQNVE